MTSNQLAYWRDQETKRSNVAKESETARHNITSEELTRAEQALTSKEIDEKQRHNLVTEAMDKLRLDFDISDAEAKNMIRMAENYAKYGGANMGSQTPDSFEKYFTEKYPQYYQSPAFGDGTGINEFFKRIGQAWESFWSPIGGGKGSTYLF